MSWPHMARITWGGKFFHARCTLQVCQWQIITLFESMQLFSRTILSKCRRDTNTSQSHFFATQSEIAREKYVRVYNYSQHGISYYVRFRNPEAWAVNSDISLEHTARCSKSISFLTLWWGWLKYRAWQEISVTKLPLSNILWDNWHVEQRLSQ